MLATSLRLIDKYHPPAPHLLYASLLVGSSDPVTMLILPCISIFQRLQEYVRRIVQGVIIPAVP